MTFDYSDTITLNIAVIGNPQVTSSNVSDDKNSLFNDLFKLLMTFNHCFSSVIYDFDDEYY